MSGDVLASVSIDWNSLTNLFRSRWLCVQVYMCSNVSYSLHRWQLVIMWPYLAMLEPVGSQSVVLLMVNLISAFDNKCCDFESSRIVVL
jgi:hypothetical protein